MSHKLKMQVASVRNASSFLVDLSVSNILHARIVTHPGLFWLHIWWDCPKDSAALWKFTWHEIYPIILPNITCKYIRPQQSAIH